MRVLPLHLLTSPLGFILFIDCPGSWLLRDWLSILSHLPSSCWESLAGAWRAGGWVPGAHPRTSFWANAPEGRCPAICSQPASPSFWPSVSKCSLCSGPASLHYPSLQLLKLPSCLQNSPFLKLSSVPIFTFFRTMMPSQAFARNSSLYSWVPGPTQLWFPGNHGDPNAATSSEKSNLNGPQKGT